LFGTTILMVVFLGAWEISPSVALGFLAAWGTLIILRRLTQLMSQFYWPQELRAHFMLPLADRELFRLQWRSAWLDSLFVLVDFVIAYGICATRLSPDGVQFMAAIWFAGIQWLLSFATAAFLLVWLQPSPYFIRLRDGFGSSLVFLVGATFVLSNLNKGLDTLVPALKWIAAVFYWVTPPGWINAAFYFGSIKGHWFFMLPLLPAALIIGTLVTSRRRLFDNFRAHAPFLAEHLTRSLATRPTPEPTAPAWTPGVSTTAGPTSVADVIGEGKYVTMPDWAAAGLVERWVRRWLSVRETNLLFIGRRSAPHWSALWQWAAKLLAAAAGIGLVAERFSPELFFWVFYLACVPAAALVLLYPDFGWPGFGVHQIINSRVPVYALLPIGHREIIKLMSKIAAVRFVASIPLLAAVGAIAGWKHGIGIGVGIRYALEVGLLCLAFQPFLFTVFIANGLRHVRTIRCALFFFGIVVLGLTLLIFSIIGMATTEKARMVVVLSTAVVSWSILLVFNRAYDRGWFDPEISSQR
jgi:hypothetical protein